MLEINQNTTIYNLKQQILPKYFNSICKYSENLVHKNKQY